MAILPEDVETKEFVVALRGYDKDEVHDYLKAVADEMRALRAGRITGSADDPLSDLGDHVMEVMRTAHDVARSLQENAKSRADELVRAASEEAATLEKEATRLLEEATRDAEKIREDAEREAVELRQKASMVWGNINVPDEGDSQESRVDARTRAAHDRLAELHEELARLAAASRDLVEVLKAGTSAVSD